VLPHLDLKPNCGSDRAWVWSTPADFADEEPKPELLAIRFANAENAQKFQEAFDKAKKLMADRLNTSGTEDKTVSANNTEDGKDGTTTTTATEAGKDKKPTEADKVTKQLENLSVTPDTDAGETKCGGDSAVETTSS
jgi:Ran-binding protein 1